MKQNLNSISVVGLGYVGLCTAATFASHGFKTVGIDIDEARVEQVRKGKAPVHEPHLEPMLKNAVRREMLEGTTDISETDSSNMTFLTVGTPSQADGSIDLTQVKNATSELGKALSEKTGYHLVVVKSTVTPGTTNAVVKPLLEENSRKTVGSQLGLCANPEFLKEGTAIHDALHPDKIIIGTNDEKSANTLKRLYQKFYRNHLPPVVVTRPETAELVKYASNAFLATKVSFINTIANIAQQIPCVDVATIAEAIGHDPRIGPLFLKAGPGYGGSCFHKDLQALINFSHHKGYDPLLFRATEQTNEQQASRVVDLCEKLTGPLNDRRITVLGLAFKKDTDDIREAASIRVIDLLRKKGANIVAFDPMAISNAKKVLGDRVEFAADPRAALKAADCCIIMTEWDQFKKLRSKDFKACMRTPNLVDARRIYNLEAFRELTTEAIGLGPTTAS